MASEKSPRLLLQCVQELYDNLHDGEEVHEAVIDSSNGSSGRRHAGFILARAEQLLLEVRNQLDVPYSSKDNPLMVRLRDHVHEISLLLTGTGLPEPGDGGTTLHDLIQNVQLLNRSVCTTNDPTCTVQ